MNPELGTYKPIPFAAALLTALWPGVVALNPVPASALSPSTNSLLERARWARLHALTGAVPLAGFVLVHLLVQASSFAGWHSHRRLSGALDGIPLAFAFEILCFYLPLGVHVALGLMRVGRSDELRAGEWGGRVGRAVRSVSALVLLAFLIFHGWQFRWRLWSGQIDRADMFPELVASLSSTALGGLPLTAGVYLLGIAAAALHGAESVYQACREWRMVSAERQRTLGRICALAGVGLFLLGALIVIDVATGSVVIRFPG